MKAMTFAFFQAVFALSLLAIVTTISYAQPAPALPLCSVSKTNTNCQLIIDRRNPVAPPTIQMYSDRQLIVIIQNPLPFERYFLDLSSAQATVAPDVASAVVGGLTGNLGKLTQLFVDAPQLAADDIIPINPNLFPALPPAPCSDLHFNDNNWPGRDQIAPNLTLFNACFRKIASDALSIYQQLDPLDSPDSLLSHSQDPTSTYFAQRVALRNQIGQYVSQEESLSNKITVISKSPSDNSPPSPEPPVPPLVYSVNDEVGISSLVSYQKVIDAVATDLAGYSQRLRDLGACGYVSDSNSSNSGNAWDNQHIYMLSDRTSYMGQCYVSTANNNTANIPGASPQWTIWSWSLPNYPVPSVIITSRSDTSAVYSGMTTRTITYSLDSLNLVSCSAQGAPTSANKKAIASIAINFADRPTVGIASPYTALRWEASAGVFLSWLPNRTLTLASDGSVIDSKTRPSPLPFAAANYRLTGDIGRSWKQNFYMSGAVGVNTNNSTAEFGFGPSYSWRLLIIGAWCHYGHDTRVAGLAPGGNGSLPTVSHWAPYPAISIGVRVPSLTGR